MKNNLKDKLINAVKNAAENEDPKEKTSEETDEKDKADASDENKEDEPKGKKISLPPKKKIVALAVISLLLIAFVSSIVPKDDTKREDDKPDPTYAGDGKTILVTSDDLDKPDTSMTSVGSPEIASAEKIEKSSKDSSTITCANGGYSIKAPSNLEGYETNDIIYLRDLSTHTQIAIINLNRSMSEPIEVYNQNQNYMTKQKAILLDKEGKECEKECYLWARGHLDDATVGSFNVKKSNGTAYYMEIDDNLPITLKTCDYFLIYEGKGVCVTGISQTLSSDEVFALMDQVLNSWQKYEAPSIDLELASYKDKKSGISFKYPKDWEVTENKDGLVTIKAPEKATYKYSGTVIQYIASNSVVNDYAQYSSDYEEQLLLPLFKQKIKSNDFTYNCSVKNMDLNAKIKNADCVYFVIQDKIFPGSKGISDSLSALGDEFVAHRWCFKSGKYNCMLNIAAPDACREEIEKIVLDSFSN